MKDCDKVKILAFVIVIMFFKAVLNVKRTRKLSLQEKVSCLILLSSWPIVAASTFNEYIRILLKSNMKLLHFYLVVLLIVLYVSVLKKAQTLEYKKRNDVHKGIIIFTVGLLIFYLSKL